MRNIHWPAHHLSLPLVLREHLAPRRLPIQNRPTLQGRMRPQSAVLDHRKTLSQPVLPAMPRLMRPKARSMLWHPSMRSLHQVLMSPTGGALMSSTRYTGMPSCWTIRGWWLTCWQLSGKFLQGTYAQSLRCMLCLPSIGSSGWWRVWSRTTRILCESSMPST